MNIIPINSRFRDEVNSLIIEEWAGPISVSKGKATDTSKIPAFIAVDKDKLVGVITYKIIDDECEIVTLNSLSENRGIGSKLINAVVQVAEQQCSKRVWVITTNDNTHAIRFYQKYGFSLIMVHINGFNNSRKIKPGIPLTGHDNIPILHEFEFEILI